MLWILRLVENIENKINKKIKIKKWDSMRIFQAVVLAAGIISLIPLIWVGLYNHMSGDDWYNARFVYHRVMEGTLSLGNVLKDVFADLIDLYTRWSFTYTGYFFCYLMPAGFGEQFAWLHTVILLVGTVCCMYFVFTRILGRCLSMQKGCARVVAVLLILLGIQYMPSPFDGFYWWSGSINNTLGFAISILGISFLVKIYHQEEKIKAGSWIFLGIGLFLIAGTSYASVLVLFCSMLLVLIDMWVYKKREKSQRIIFSGLFVWYILCVLFAMTAPGNARRFGALTDAGSSGYSPVKAIVCAYIEGLKLIYEQWNIGILLILLVICLLAIPMLLAYRQKFKNPIIVVTVTYSIYITSFIPTLYAEGLSGEPRVQNIQYWYSLIFLTINVLYSLGWYLKKKDIASESALLTRYKTEIMGLCLIFCAVFMLKGEQEPASKVALKGMLTEEVQQFDSELDAREELYRLSRGEEVVAEQLSVIPEIFEGYTDLREEKFWINSNVRDFYQLKRLRSSINGQVVD